MWRIYAEKFHMMSTLLAKHMCRTELATSQQGADDLDECLKNIQNVAAELGLRMTLKQVGTALRVLGDPNRNPETMVAELNQLHIRFYQELEEELFCYIPREKVAFASVEFWRDEEINKAFPSTLREFWHAGRCYAFGQETACVFHLMRIVDCGLKATAASLGMTYSSQSWHTVATYIETQMEKKYQHKSQNWRDSEPLYAEILTDISAIGKAHRNPSLHELEKYYEAPEAHHLMLIVQGFMRHLAKGGLHER